MPVDQINTRVDPELKARYDAVAATLDMPAAQIFRELFEANIAEWETKAEEATRKRHGWPGNIPNVQVEQALERFLKCIGRTEPLKLLPRDLYAAEAKALWILLSWIWAEDDAGDVKARKKLGEWFESLNIKALDLFIQPPSGKPLPESKPVRNYARRDNAE